jgi:tRNA A37 threonylcarbamoyladenosine biosynthesis protein TsaE
VEWGDRVRAILPPERLDVLLEAGATDDERRVTIDPTGTSWARRAEALAASVASPSTRGRT